MTALTRRKKYTAIGIVIIVILTSILLAFVYSPHSNSFTVSFTGETRDGVTAVTYLDENHTIINEELKSLFARDLARIANESWFVDGITVVDHYWFWIINAGVADVDGQGWYVLESVKSEIEELWYVDRATYNTKGHVALP